MYLLMGVSLFLVIREGFAKRGVKVAVTIFFSQLIFNILWSIVFFGMQSIIGGFIVILVLLVLVFTTMVAFYPISKIASVLLLPYLL